MLYLIATVIGYIASLFLAISLIVNNDLKFRWINALGCLFFIVYGVMIHAIPIVLTNAFLLVINIYYLIKIYRTHEDFDLIEFKGDERLIHKFLQFYQKDIHDYFPDYHHDQKENNINFIVLRDLVIANIFVAELEGNGIALVKLNYTVPKYRDYKVGRFIFTKEKEFLRSKGVRRLLYESVAHKGHEKFLGIMGFRKMDYGRGGGYVKEL
ncbi:MAG: hypothetical protein ABI237_18770 [Ginsengibacter sp.]